MAARKVVALIERVRTSPVSRLIRRISDLILPYREAYGPERIEPMTEAEMKDWVDKATYEELVHKWRFSSMKDPFFQGKMGVYYKRKLEQKKKEGGSASG